MCNCCNEPVDGSVYAYQVSPTERLVYVTIKGPDEKKPMLVAFDADDLNALNRARKELTATIRPTYVNPRFDDSAPRAGFITDRKWW